MGNLDMQSMPVDEEGKKRKKKENGYVFCRTKDKQQHSNKAVAKQHHTNGYSKSLPKSANFNDSLVEVEEEEEVEESMADDELEENKPEFMDGIPQDMEVLTNQVAGHIIEDSGGIGMLKKDGLAYKPLLKKDTAETEVKIYELLETTNDGLLIEMRQLVPKYHGVQKLSIKGREIDFLVLEDLTKDFKEPCIMDVKIGRRTWDPTAGYQKIIAEESKYNECKRDLGFCIPGFQVYKIANNQLVMYDKNYGKSLNKDTARDAIKMFLNADTNHFCRKLLMQLLASLWQIQHFARNQRRLRLYATSILLVYDARRLREHVQVNNPTKNHRPRGPPLTRHRSLYRPISLAQLNNDCEKIPTGFSGQLTSDGPILKPPIKKFVNLEGPRIVNNNNTWQKSIHALKRTHSFQNNYDKDVQNRKQNYTFMLDDLCCDSKSVVWATAKMIDFAHVYPADSFEVDRNYLDGVENLIKILEDFLAEAEE